MSDLRQIVLTPGTDSGDSIMYVMSRDQRVRDNHVLLAAQAEALELQLPLTVVFNLYYSLGHRKREHFEFMVDGLKEVETDLKKKNIPFIMMIGDIPQNIQRLASELNPRTIYFDFSPLRHSRNVQKKLASAVDCRVVVVDTHNVIPTWVVSDKEEFAAHTIRRKIHKVVGDWIVEPGDVKHHPHDLAKLPDSASWNDVDKTVAKIPTSGIRHDFKSGEAAAHAALRRFIEIGLKRYANDRNDANAEAQSNLSPYLHYGQVSSLRILLDIMDAKSHPPQILTSPKMPVHGKDSHETNGIDSFIEELVVRKELADNFCLHNPNYDKISGAKDWARKTLENHKNDPREFTYSYEQLEAGETHDALWNAAQSQLTKTGKIHGYMRMYWAKKLLEWTNDPATAINWAIKLNDSYHLDGGDPNGYVGILWSIAGVHDRPWFDREIFGTIRYMAESGAKKKFDTEAYITRWTNDKA